MRCHLPSLAICRRGRRGSVAEVRDGETLALTDGTLVRLINAKAPAAPLAARSDRPWPFAAKAKLALTELASGAEIELRYGGAKANRHGRALAQVCVVKGGERLWLQGELVGKGLATRLSPSPTITLASTISSPARPRRGRRALACGALGLIGCSTLAMWSGSGG